MINDQGERESERRGGRFGFHGVTSGDCGCGFGSKGHGGPGSEGEIRPRVGRAGGVGRAVAADQCRGGRRAVHDRAKDIVGRAMS